MPRDIPTPPLRMRCLCRARAGALLLVLRAAGPWGACCTLAIVSAACTLTDRAMCALVHQERFWGIQHAGYAGLNNRPRTLLAAERGLQGMQLSACAASSPALHAKPALYSSARCVQAHAAVREPALLSFPLEHLSQTATCAAPCVVSGLAANWLPISCELVSEVCCPRRHQRF